MSFGGRVDKEKIVALVVFILGTVMEVWCLCGGCMVLV